MARYFLLLLAICMAMYTEGQICGSSTPPGLTANVNTAYTNAFNWVLSQRTYNWEWPWLNTRAAILSLQLTNSAWYAIYPQDLANEQSVNKLEIELLADLSQSTPAITPGNLASYIMALNSTCHDVTNFYGHNLTAMLEPSMDTFNTSNVNFNNYFQYSLGLLALCQCGATIKSEYVQQIMDGDDGHGVFQFGSDVSSIALMAMVCIRDQVSDSQDKDFLKAKKRIGNYLAIEDYDNAISAALAAQALRAYGKPYNQWGCSNLIQEDVLNKQSADGSFGGSLAGTLQILPLLGNTSFADVVDVIPNCSGPPTTAAPPGTTQPPVSVTLKVENTIDTSQATVTINVPNVPSGSTLHAAMSKAQEQDSSSFSFETQLYSFGYSITSINGVSSEGTYYWSILIGVGNDQESANFGISGIIVENGQTYTFRYISWL